MIHDGLCLYVFSCFPSLPCVADRLPPPLQYSMLSFPWCYVLFDDVDVVYITLRRMSRVMLVLQCMIPMQSLT